MASALSRWAFLLQGQWNKALVDANAALKRKEAAEYFDTRANIYKKMGEYEQALADFRIAMTVGRKAYIVRYHKRLKEKGLYTEKIDGFFGAGSRLALAACVRDPDCSLISPSVTARTLIAGHQKKQPSLERCRQRFARFQRFMQKLGSEFETFTQKDPLMKEAIERCRRERMDFLHGMDFVSTSLGWVVGWHGLINHTTDGGASWSEQNLPPARICGPCCTTGWRNGRSRRPTPGPRVRAC